MRSTAFALLLLTLAGCAGTANTAADGGYTGRWRTTWREGNASLTLVQRGTRVEGDYGYKNGSLFGTADGRKLRGEWVEGDSDTAGTFEIELTPDGQGFVGSYATSKNGNQSGYWTASRVF